MVRVVAVIALLLAPLRALAQSEASRSNAADPADDEFSKLWEQVGMEARQMAESFPEIPPELSLQLGFNYLKLEGAPETLKYGDAEHFAMPFLSVRHASYTRANRIHADLHAESPTDFSGDLAYRFKSLFAFRGVVSASRANLARHELVSLSPDPNDPLGPAARDPASGVRNAPEEARLPVSNTLRFQGEARLLMPGYPAKAFLRAFVFRRDSTADLSLLGGSGYFDDLERVVHPHHLETLNARLEAGANGHIGPAEIEGVHEEMWFSRQSRPAYYTYPYGAQAGATYPIAAIPSLRGQRDTVRAHTAANGRLYFAGAVQREARKNEETSVRGDATSASATTRVHPVERVTLSATYDVRRADFSRPRDLVLTDTGALGLDQAYTGIKPLSGTTQSVRSHVSYRPQGWATLSAEWSHQDRLRANAEEWHVAPRTLRDAVAGHVSIRPNPSFDLSCDYRYETATSPAYNWDPTTTHRPSATLRLRPWPFLTASLSYQLALHTRHDLRFTVPGTTVTEGEADIVSHNAFATVTVSAEQTALTVAYGYQQFDDRQTLVYWAFAPAATVCAPGEPCAYVHEEAEYASRAHFLVFDLSHAATEKVTLGGRGTFSTGRSELTPGQLGAGSAVSIGAFSKREISETHLQAYARIDVGSGWTAGLGAGWDQLLLAENPYNPTRNGSAVSGSASMQKLW